MKTTKKNENVAVPQTKTNLNKALEYYEHVLYMIMLLSDQPDGAERFDEFIKKNEIDGRYMNWYDAPVHGGFDDVVYKTKYH